MNFSPNAKRKRPPVLGCVFPEEAWCKCKHSLLPGGSLEGEGPELKRTIRAGHPEQPPLAPYNGSTVRGSPGPGEVWGRPPATPPVHGLPISSPPARRTREPEAAVCLRSRHSKADVGKIKNQKW